MVERLRCTSLLYLEHVIQYCFITTLLIDTSDKPEAVHRTDCDLAWSAESERLRKSCMRRGLGFAGSISIRVQEGSLVNIFSCPLS